MNGKIYIYMATKIYLQNLSEFIYHGIISKGFNYLFKILDREDILKIKTESKVRQFAENANLEEKIILMSRIGFGCGIVFWDKEKQKVKKVEDVIIGYVDTDPTDVMHQIIKDKVFAFKDIDLVKSLQTISHVCTSKSYSVNRRFLHIKSKAMNTRTLVNKLDAERNLEWYSKTLSFAYDIEETLESFKINTIQFRILLYLHTLPNGATRDNITRKLNRSNITGMLTEMYNSNMVAFSGENRNVVSIDTYGIIILDQIFTKFP
jgi:hypothetical protein